MPKMKTKGAVKKRFRASKKGKISFKRAGKNHLQSKHNKKHRRRQTRDSVLSKADKKTVKKLESNEKKQAKRYASNESLEKSLSSANLLKDGILMIISNQINRILPAEKVIFLPI